MLIETIPRDQQNKLFLAIESNLSSFKKRSISYIIDAHSDSVATVIIYVSGRQGIVSKDLVIIYDTLNLEWNIYSEGKKYTLVSISELSTVVSSMIAKLSTVVTKI